MGLYTSCRSLTHAIAPLAIGFPLNICFHALAAATVISLCVFSREAMPTGWISFRALAFRQSDVDRRNGTGGSMITGAPYSVMTREP
jgi:hypothetical protein